MAIFIKDKTACRICGKVIASSASMVGFPNMELPSGLGDLADGCMHRSCLDEHSRRDDLQQAWKQHWLAQAERVGADASINRHGAVVYHRTRFTFAALDSFVDIEDQVEALDQLRSFFPSFDGRERLSTVTNWNTYELAPGVTGTRLLVTANASPSAALRVTQENALLDYEFDGDRWAAFVRGWADPTSR